MNNKFNFFLYAFLAGIFYFVFAGIISALIPNYFFIRMTPISKLDIIFLSISSILIGIFVYLYMNLKNKKSFFVSCASGGGIFSFIAIACPVCNKVVVLLVGVSGALTYFEPIQPYVGIAGILLLLYIDFKLYKIIKKINEGGSKR